MVLASAFLPLTSTLRCYKCRDSSEDQCGDPFNRNGIGVVEVTAVSNYCWKIEAQVGNAKGPTIEGGTFLK
ncbi:unnamed protein product [Rotaria sordida]|uniref:Protein sleepless n=1 Tax=Rotaria sordida TaxID=392033 RepID=A0A815FDX9_9BILA|nr:unnamed protein product [Rotaria sordida]